MKKLVVGIFKNGAEAQAAVEELKNNAYDPESISVVMHKDETYLRDKGTGERVVEGVASGAAAGTLLGALAGFLIGLGFVTIPGIGALLIGGPLAASIGLTGAAATTATGAITGIVAGSLIGGLVKLGIPETEATTYIESIKGGAALVAVSCEEEKATEVEDILKVHNVENLNILRV